MDSTIARARELYLAGDLPAPNAVPCVCTAPRSEHSGKTGGGGHKATGCARYRADKVVELAVAAAAAAESTLRQDLAAWDRMSRAATASKGAPAVRPSELGTCTICGSIQSIARNCALRVSVRSRAAPPSEVSTASCGGT